MTTTRRTVRVMSVTGADASGRFDEHTMAVIRAEARNYESIFLVSPVDPDLAARGFSIAGLTGNGERPIWLIDAHGHIASAMSAEHASMGAQELEDAYKRDAAPRRAIVGPIYG